MSAPTRAGQRIHAECNLMEDRCFKSRRVVLSKLEAARRQIESAIWLWFVDGDIVSVNTLVTAAQRLLLELASLWETSAWPCTAGYLSKNEKEERSFGSGDAVEYFNCIKDEETLEVCEQWTELCLFDTIMAYCNLTHDRCGSALMSTFVVRFGVQRQDLFVPDAFSLLEERVSTAFNLDRLQRLSKMDFLKEFIGVLGGAASN